MQSYKVLLHGVTANSQILHVWDHKQSLLILFTMQKYKSYDMMSMQTVINLSFSPCKATISYYMVSPQTVFTYPFHHAKLQVLLHGVTTNSLKTLSCFTMQSYKSYYLILFTMQSYKSYYMASPQTVFTYPFHHAKLQVTFMQNLTTWCHRKQSLLILHHAKLQIFTWCSCKSLYLSF